MMKNNVRNKVNLVFSCFLVIGYIVCSYFFSTMANQVSGVVGALLQSLILMLFGLLLFWSTRVGEGRQVKRFSLAVLLLIVLPCVYILAAGLVEGLPLHDVIAPIGADGGRSQSILMIHAAVGLGYGIPYTFVSGYEMADEEEADAPAVEEYAPIEGGLAEELAQAEAEAEKEAEEAVEEAEAEADAAIEVQEIQE
jgi:hypothetical protein